MRFRPANIRVINRRDSVSTAFGAAVDFFTTQADLTGRFHIRDMSNEAVTHHRQAADHYEKAARSHREAADHHGKGHEDMAREANEQAKRHHEEAMQHEREAEQAHRKL